MRIPIEKLSKQQMISMGASGVLSQAYLRYIPIDEIVSLDPEPADWTDNEGEVRQYTSGQEIKIPIEVKYDRENKTYDLYDGNHRIKQAKINGDTHILAFIEPDKGQIGDHAKIRPSSLLEYTKAFKKLLKEEYEHKTKFYEVDKEEILDRLVFQYIPKEAKQKFLKKFYGKSGKEFYIKGRTFENSVDVYDLKNDMSYITVGHGWFDVHSDYITSVDFNDSVWVKEEYRNTGIATAIIDFAEIFFNKPFYPSKALSSEMQILIKKRFGKEYWNKHYLKSYGKY